MKKALFAILVCLLLPCICSCVKNGGLQEVSDENERFVFHLENGLYDIGEFSSGEKYVHFTGKPSYEFVPRDDYGSLLPFSGGVKRYYTKESSVAYGFDMSYSKYGLCTTDGKIVVEPVYAYINSFTSDDGFKYYDMSYENDVEVDENGNIINFDDVFIANKRVIIPFDGSWKIELENGSYVSGAGDGMITVCEINRETGENMFKLYDYDGNYLFTVDTYEYVEKYSCGYAAARIYPEYGHDAKNTRQNGVCVYLDKSGNPVLEGFTDGTGFNRYGVASVQIDGNKYALINTDGEFLTEAVYDSLYSAGIDGYYQGFIADSKLMHVFDGNGKIVGNVTGNGTGYMSLTQISDGDILYSYYNSESNGELWYRLSDNSPFVCEENGKMPNSYGGKNVFVYKATENGSAYYGDETSAIVFDANGKTIANIDKFTYINWVDDEAHLMGYVRNNPEAKPMTGVSQTEFAVLDIRSGEEVCVLKNSHFAQCIPGFPGILAVQTEKREENDIKVVYYFYDIEENCVMKGFENIEQYATPEADGKRYVTVCRNDSVTVYDGDFNIVLKKHLDKNV